MLGQRNIRIIWHLSRSFADKFVMYGVTIESPIESPMVSPTILNSPGSKVQDQPYQGYLYPPKTNYISRSPWLGMTTMRGWWRQKSWLEWLSKKTQWQFLIPPHKNPSCAILYVMCFGILLKWVTAAPQLRRYIRVDYPNQLKLLFLTCQRLSSWLEWWTKTYLLSCFTLCRSKDYPTISLIVSSGTLVKEQCFLWIGSWLQRMTC